MALPFYVYLHRRFTNTKTLALLKDSCCCFFLSTFCLFCFNLPLGFSLSSFSVSSVSSEKGPHVSNMRLWGRPCFKAIVSVIPDPFQMWRVFQSQTSLFFCETDQTNILLCDILHIASGNSLLSSQVNYALEKRNKFDYLSMCLAIFLLTSPVWATGLLLLSQTNHSCSFMTIS